MKKISRRSFLQVLSVAAAAVALTACGGGSDASSVSSSAAAGGASSVSAVPNTALSEETLTVALNAEPAALTGLAGTSTEAGMIVMNTLGSSLYRYDGETRDAKPALATGYEMIDETHYRFTLRDGICYSDGSPVTAEDVLYSLTCYFEGGMQDASYFNIDEFAVEDEKHIVIAFKEYVPGWLYLVSEASAAIFSQAAVDAVGGVEAAERTVPVGCGPYKFVEWKSGEYIMVERNENYWDTEAAPNYYKYIKFIFIGDAASRTLAVQSGDADVAYRVATTDYITAGADPNTDAVEIPCDSIYNVVFNCSSEKMSNAKLREAVAYGIDAAAVNALITMGQGELCQGLWSPAFPYMHDVYPGGVLTYDPEKAQAALAEAGYPDGTSLKLICLSSNQGIATIVQENLRQIGIEVEISILEQSVYLPTSRSGDYDMQIGSSTVGTVQPNAFNLVDPAKIGVSVQSCRIQDPAMSDLVSMAYSSDEAIMEEGFSGIIDYVFNNFCLRGLCTESKYCVVKAGLAGLSSCNRMGYLSVENAYIQ